MYVGVLVHGTLRHMQGPKPKCDAQYALECDALTSAGYRPLTVIPHYSIWHCHRLLCAYRMCAIVSIQGYEPEIPHDYR